MWKDDKFEVERPEKSPTVDVRIAINTYAHRKLKNYQCRTPPDKPIVVKAIADTGAQTCTAGLDVLNLIPDGTRWLLRTRHGLKGVTHNGLKVRGVLLIEFSLHGHSSTELLYICDNVTGLYLSQTALKNLQLIRQNFPEPEETVTDSSAITENSDAPKAPCGCPLRSPCPPVPDKLPFPATEEYRDEFEKWILNYFASSAFNVCTHQNLQTMTGAPLQMAFTDDCEPVATHKPIPIPHHWKDTVKEKLDADVSLGIIEPVPQGTPTTWCSRMVVVAKKDGSPRRTVDLQNLNKATKRATHHTPTPFNVVSVVPCNKKKTVIDAWNDIIVFYYHPKLEKLQRLSPNGADIDIAAHLKVFMHQMMAIPKDSMTLRQGFLELHESLTTLYYGTMILQRRFGIP